jgi:hypothetical protein
MPWSVYDRRSGTWTVLPDDPLPPAYDRFAVVDGDRVLVFASPLVESDQEGQPKVGAAYDLVAGTWTELPTAPGAGYQVWRAGDRAFLNPHFGAGGGGVLDLRSDTWGPFPDGPDGPDWRGDLAGVVSHEGAVYEYADGWVFDARDDSWLEVPSRGSEVDEESLAAVGQAPPRQHGLLDIPLGKPAVVVRLGVRRGIQVPHEHARHPFTSRRRPIGASPSGPW